MKKIFYDDLDPCKVGDWNLNLIVFTMTLTSVDFFDFETALQICQRLLIF